MAKKELNPQSVEFAVRKTAETNSAYNVDSNLTEDRKIAHVEACKQIVAWADKHENIPFYLVLQFCVAQGAPKNDVYAKGYAKRVKGTDQVMPNVNISRATQCAKWYNYYKKSNIGGGSLDVVARTILKFYAAQVNPKTGKVNPIKADQAFYCAVKAAEELGKYNGNGHGDFKAMCKNLGLEIEKAKAETAEVVAA